MGSELAYSTWFDSRKAVIFDLDGTIYREWDYLSAAYLEIGKDLENKSGIPQIQVYQFLKDEFTTHGRKGLFDKLIERFSFPEGYMKEALSIQRNTKLAEKITGYPEIRECLKWLVQAEKKIFIVTNGNTIQQKNKIENIEFGGLLKHIEVIYANEMAAKPDPAVFFYLRDKYHLLPQEVVMIGDSPTDESFASASGIDFIYVGKMVALL